MTIRYLQGKHFGIIPPELLDDEDALKEWLADEAAKDGLTPLVVELRETKTYDEKREHQIPITVAEGLCYRAERQLPTHLTYQVVGVPLEWPDAT
jgi:hypothetical protein